LAAALDFAKEVFADADATCSVILLELLSLAASAYHLADGGCIVDGYFHDQSSRFRGFFSKSEHLAINPRGHEVFWWQ